MSGHSKWATIKHKKAATDAKRGRTFTHLIKEIAVAARGGGGDPDANPRLRTAIVAAKAASMPADNIKRAVQRGTGELPGAQYEEVTFEGYGPGGAAILVDVATDNRNRTVSEVRHIFSRQGGNLGEAGEERRQERPLEQRRPRPIWRFGFNQQPSWIVAHAVCGGPEQQPPEIDIAAERDPHPFLALLRPAGVPPRSQVAVEREAQPIPHG